MERSRHAKLQRSSGGYALGSNDEILEDGELSGDFEAIKESGYDFPNPCAMSVEAVRTVNEKGYEAAFNEFWREFMPEKGDDAPTLSEAAKDGTATAVGATRPFGITTIP